MPYWYPEVYLKMWYPTNTGGYQPGRNRFFKQKVIQFMKSSFAICWWFFHETCRNFSKTQNWRLFYSENFQKTPKHRLLVLIFILFFKTRIGDSLILQFPKKPEYEVIKEIKGLPNTMVHIGPIISLFKANYVTNLHPDLQWHF